MKMLKKTLVLLFILSLIIPPQTASAALNLEQNYPSPTESMDRIMNDLGVDKSEVKKNIDETLNVIDYKKDPPGVTLTFVPESPMENKKLTALASPANFTGDPERMYYTWYLKHKDCEKAEKGDSNYAEDCDLNRDDKVDEEDWKIEAMGILARGDWKPDYASKDIAETTLDEDDNGYEDDYDYYYEIVQEEEGSDPDKDGYDSVFGGEDQKGKPEHCYIRDIEAGIDYEIMESDCDKGIHADKETILSVPIFDINSADSTITSNEVSNPLTVSTGSSGGVASIEFTPSAAPLVSAMDSTEWARLWLFYTFNGQWQGYRGDALGWDSGSLKSAVSIDDGSAKIPEDWIWHHCDEDSGKNVYVPPVGETLYFALTDAYVTENTKRTSGGEFLWDVEPTPSEEGTESGCKHVFPKKYYVDGDEISILAEDDEDLMIGDPDKGSFTTMEEKFWGTDPESDDTNNDGVTDEKTLTGLGMNSFSWTYKKGDLIGVALEGVSDNTNYDDSSFKVMWGLPTNDFDGDDNCEIDPVTITSGSGSEEIERNLTFGTDINDCLEENFVDPTKGTADKRIEVAFSYSPQNPINDTLGNNSDTLAIRADLSNIENKSFVKYAWTFWMCLSNTDDQCTEMTKNFLDQYATGVTKTTGLGIDSVKMRLKMPTNTLFLKAELQVLETTEDAGEKSGKGKIFIPLQHTSDDIIPQKVQAIEDLSLSTDVRLTQNGIRYANLTTDCPEKTCSTVKNEILSLRFNGADVANKILSWTLDGKPLIASGSDPRTVYFPILKDQGATYSVKLAIADTDGDKLGKEKIILARDFKVEDPRVEIRPENCVLPTEGASADPCRFVEEGKLLNPLDRTAVLEVDYNENLFQSQKNSIVLIRPALNFDRSALRESNIQGNPVDIWFVDGAPADRANIDADGNLLLPINKEAGEKYKISFQALHTQPMLIKRALGNIWNVPDETFYERTISDSLEIEVIETPETSYRSGTKKILASVFSGLPNYVNFLFRTVLTLALILFVANLSFILFPKQKRY